MQVNITDEADRFIQDHGGVVRIHFIPPLG